MTRRVASLYLLLILPIFSHAQMSPGSLQGMRSLAFSACSNLLLSFNPTQTDVDPDVTHRYHREFQELRVMLGSADDLELRRLGDVLLAAVAELEAFPLEDSQFRPVRINHILEAQANLDRLIHERYSALQYDEFVISVDKLRLDVQRLLLYYQIRTFGSLAVYLDELRSGSPEALDSSVIVGFRRIEQERPQAAKIIANLRKKYDFVRPHLIRDDSLAVPSIAVYYLGKVSDELEGLSGQEASLSHAY